MTQHASPPAGTKRGATTHNRTVGARGESIAAAYLEGLGYRIIERNWFSRYGELDIVAADGSTIVAVEVKTRTGLGYGHPLEAITQRKAARLRRLLLEWCRATGGAGSAAVAADAADSVGSAGPGGVDTRIWWELLRVDAVGIVLHPGSSPRIDHLRGIS